MAAENEVRFSVGQKFSLFIEVKNAIKVYENAFFCKLTTKDSRTIASGMKKAPKKCEKINADLKYCELVFACVHGGEHKTKGTGLRRTQ